MIFGQALRKVGGSGLHAALDSPNLEAGSPLGAITDPRRIGQPLFANRAVRGFKTQRSG